MSRSKHTKEHTQNSEHQSKHHQQRSSLLGSFFRHRGHNNKSSSTNMPSSTSDPIPMSFTEVTSSSDISEDTRNSEDLPIAPPAISVDRTIAQSSIEKHLSGVKAQSRLIASSQELRRMYTKPENLEVLENGGVLFAFACHHKLTPYESEMVNSTINITGFLNEETENFVPHFDYEEYQRQLLRQEQLAMDRSLSSSVSQPSVPKYTFLLTRCGYLLTGIDLKRLLDNPQIMTTLEYQRSCQPEGTKIWDDTQKMDADNFRMTKPIIPYIFNFTIQFKVSRVTDTSELQRLSQHLHVPVDGAIVLERTKRSVPPKEDSTRKIKSILAYTDLGKGVVLVSHLTVMLQVGLPEIIERILGTIGQWGMSETAETAWRTRRYLQTQLPHVSTTEEQAVFLDASSEMEHHKTVDVQSSDDDDDGDFFDAVDDVAQDLSSGMADLAVH